MLFFNKENQEKIYLGSLPVGRVFKKAWVKGTNFNFIVKWIARVFEGLVDRCNETFRGLYICESAFLIENHKKEFNIPNYIFYETNIEEHRADIFVLKYLMRGNIAWNFIAIANIYGVNIDLKVAVEDGSKAFVLDFPVPFLNVNKPLEIVFYRERVSPFTCNFPMVFGEEDKIVKLKKIFNEIKPVYLRINYKYEEPNNNQLIKFC